MTRAIFPIARTTFVESLRQPVVLLLIMVSALAQIISTASTAYSLGYQSLETSEVAADNKLLFDIGLSTIFVVGVLLAGFVATAVFSKEIQNKTVLTVVSKPVGRVALVVGKFLGVAGAISIASVIMVIFLLMALRHGVLTTAADDVDWVVVLFGGSAVVLALGLAAWANFFYGWNFPQTAVLLMLPLLIVAYIVILFINHRWQLQSPSVSWMPQVVTACGFLVLAVLVLSAFALAFSTRLGQVMTIVLCLGLFLAALLSNYFVGRFVFRNNAIAQVDTVALADNTKPFIEEQGPLVIKLRRPLERSLPPGTPIWWSTSPNGFPMFVHAQYEAIPAQSLGDVNNLIGPKALGPAIIALSARDQEVTIRNIGPVPVAIDRLPESGDYLFTKSTQIRPVPLAIWGAIPNLQFFWVVDAVSQNRPLTPAYMGFGAIYALIHIIAALALAVILFQTRDVG